MSVANGAAQSVVVAPADLGVSPTKQGKIVSKGGSGAWDEAMVEGPQVFWDAASSRWGMVYVGYSGVFSGGFPPVGSIGRVGLAWSTDLLTWAKDPANPILSPAGALGVDWDAGTLTAPSMYVQDGVYHLFYAGTQNAGWEASGGGTLKMGVATASTVTGPYTRAGGNPIISPTSGWRGKHIFHRSIVKKGSTYYMFFNASDTSNVEKIGYATASALTGPWTVDDANSPVLQGAGGVAWDANYTADPSVHKLGGMWVMAYAGGKTGTATRDGSALTTDANFPLGWARHPSNPQLIPSETYDLNLCGKPCIVRYGSRLYHFYSAKAGDDSDVSCAVAVSS